MGGDYLRNVLRVYVAIKDAVPTRQQHIQKRLGETEAQAANAAYLSGDALTLQGRFHSRNHRVCAGCFAAKGRSDPNPGTLASG
jgi:hypothetical protein